jgi:hypothetical protein
MFSFNILVNGKGVVIKISLQVGVAGLLRNRSNKKKLIVRESKVSDRTREDVSSVARVIIKIVVPA